jgi:hypothetical protein
MKSKVWSLKSKVFSALLCGLCVSALIPGAMGQTNTPAGALVTFAITNSDATPYNGPLWVYTVGPGPEGRAILADGSFFITGVTKRIEVTNSLGSLRLMRGTYFASNSVMAYCLAVPLDSGTNNAASLKIGGYNIFEYVPGVTSDVASNIAQVVVGSAWVSHYNWPFVHDTVSGSFYTNVFLNTRTALAPDGGSAVFLGTNQNGVFGLGFLDVLSGTNLDAFLSAVGGNFTTAGKIEADGDGFISHGGNLMIDGGSAGAGDFTAINTPGFIGDGSAVTNNPLGGLRSTNAPHAGYYLRVDATGTNLYYSPN